jgi:tetratricopeptide (TPR) repeat protein
VRLARWPVLCAVIVAASSGEGVDAQAPPLTVTQQATKEAEELAQRVAEEAARFAKGWQVGQLHPEAAQAFYRWEAAVQLWKKEKSAGASPLLAEGVLFDCLSRLKGVKTLGFKNEGPGRLDILEAKRPARATKAFDAALKIDPHLIEARVRAARIRAQEDSRAAVQLETIANDAAKYPFAYLSAVSRAAVAHAKSDSVTALAWYERALALNPRSTAGAIAISALNPARPVSFEALGTDDLYYSYPCTILTPDVAGALAERIRKVALK